MYLYQRHHLSTVQYHIILNNIMKKMGSVQYIFITNLALTSKDHKQNKDSYNLILPMLCSSP
jgi:hypothetical protein